MGLLEDVIRDFSWKCHAYVLMGNHYHLLIETPEGNLSYGMKQLNGSYAQGFNARHNRVGHLTQGRFFSRLIEDDDYLFTLYLYIHLNPVKEGLVPAPDSWRWSSYRAYAGLVPSPPFLETGYSLSLFSEDPVRSRKAFVKFIETGLERICSNEIEGILGFYFHDFADPETRKQVIRKAHLEHNVSAATIAAYLGVNKTTIYRALE